MASSTKKPHSKRLLHRYLRSQIPSQQISSFSQCSFNQLIDNTEEFDDDDILKQQVPVIDHSTPNVMYAIDALNAMYPDLIKKRKDIPPHFVETSNATPQLEFLEWIDNGHLHPSLLPIIRDRQVPFYDGSIVIEIHDYRMASLLSNGASQAPFCSGGKSLLSDHPEIHRVLLRPNEASIAADIQMYLDSTLGEGLWSDEQYIELEKGIRNTTSLTLCLDPSPGVFQIINFIRLQGGKYKILRDEPSVRAKKFRQYEANQKSTGALLTSGSALSKSISDSVLSENSNGLLSQFDQGHQSTSALDQRLFGLPTVSL
ncbi:Transcription factor spt20 [Mitosporidium daphniae]|uniref:Fam48A protein n=1 Tax=Mitosporidium daphniae TaxID=1485682 RepID=A0A098VP05_9MICR|nr:uncharacterized protein DI09_56p110 [Mitosporidium daphniae]XP_013239077.1 Fam48A protein [Mitosporidium daphniae]KGG50773.1 hypothetical protein DI09_56p110 [Mitosporidium daphniae]KGG52650.1 Fam48A protein [Mitosporidium daphniae]|eukprot:XP_013237200.1 uncharacterized protein DI09_56p110 [Mitosporidium daphniae]